LTTVLIDKLYTYFYLESSLEKTQEYINNI